MSASPPINLIVAQSLFQAVAFPQNVVQAIFNVVITTTPTTARISFSGVIDAAASVTLFLNAQVFQHAELMPFAPSHYAVTFTNLPQNTEIGMEIRLQDGPISVDSLPAGQVTFTSIIETGVRDAIVTLRSLREVQGEAEITFRTRLYEFDAGGSGALTPVLQYGRAHMDPNGNPIGDPFGPPVAFGQAPDVIAFYTLANVQLEGVGVGIGAMLPDIFPNDAPSHVVGGGEAQTSAQKIVTLPDAVGDYELTFSYMSGVFDYVFEVDGFITGTVSAFNYPEQLSMMKLPPRKIRVATALPGARRAVVWAGDAQLMFMLLLDGSVARLRAGTRSKQEVERLGDVTVAHLVVAGRSDGTADLFGLKADGALAHARAGATGPVVWRDLGAALAAGPAVVRAPDGQTHLFGVAPDGALLHASIDNGSVPHAWDRLGDGFANWVSGAGNDAGKAVVVLRRGGEFVHAALELTAEELGPPGFQSMAAPFSGPAVVGTVEEGGFAALGWDERRVFWLSRFDGSWDRVGTLDEVLAADEGPR